MTMSAKGRENIRLARIGKTHSKATKQRIGLKSRGRRHSKRSKELIGAAASTIMKVKWSDPEFKRIRSLASSVPRPSMQGIMPKNLQTPNRFDHVKRGYYNINGVKMFFRSKWEANYALYLNFLCGQRQIEHWEYEPESFLFEKIKSGTRTYRPDFKVFRADGGFEFHEIKGWMDPQSLTKLKRMRIYFPHIKIVVIDKVSYHDIKKKVGGMLKFY